MADDSSSLKRSPSPTPNDNTEHSGRQRSRAACLPCRQRKRKCDGRMPCSTCMRYEYQCFYKASKRSPYNPPGDPTTEPSQALSMGSPKPARTQKQRHPLTAPGARLHHRGILDPTKTRFVKANSAIAFPRILSMDLESDSIPRLHSFAWNLGIRSEPHEQLADITTMLNWADVQRLSRTYFTVVRPDVGHIDEAEYMEAATARYTKATGNHDIDAVMLGVAALGSFFSSDPHPSEADFVKHAYSSLREHSIQRSPTFNNVSAWILRTLYQRLTTRPHTAWISSCITMHQAEASGLHKELQTIAVVYPAVPVGDHKVAKTRRRLFWVARTLNVILSFEYGRSPVTFDVVTTKRPAAESGTHVHQFIELAELLPSDVTDNEREPDPPAALATALTRIEDMQSDSSFINTLRADLAFGIYRRLWLMSLTDAKDRAESIMAVGKAALEASARLLEARIPWSNMISAPFQFLCVVLAAGTPKSLAFVGDIMRQLHAIAQIYDTHMVREAYNQALSLVNMAKKRKEKEINALNLVDHTAPLDGPVPHTTASSGTSEPPPEIDWASVDIPYDWNWDAFLNPSLIMSASQAQPVADGAYDARPYMAEGPWR